ncbi:MAG: hypothetical protein RLZZ628_4194, partial [Bacteroidota bacterium]
IYTDFFGKKIRVNLSNPRPLCSNSLYIFLTKTLERTKTRNASLIVSAKKL